MKEVKEKNQIQSKRRHLKVKKKTENTINLPPLTDTINLCNLINLKKIDEPKFSNDFNMENRSNDIEIISEIKPIKSFNEVKVKKKKSSHLFKHKSESNLKKDSTNDKITIYKPIIRFDSSKFMLNPLFLFASKLRFFFECFKAYQTKKHMHLLPKANLWIGSSILRIQARFQCRMSFSKMYF